VKKGEEMEVYIRGFITLVLVRGEFQPGDRSVGSR